MGIEVKNVRAYLAPTKGRRYLTKKAAIHNEATSIIFKYYPLIEIESDTGYFEDLRITRPAYFKRKYDALCEALRNTVK